MPSDTKAKPSPKPWAQALPMLQVAVEGGKLVVRQEGRVRKFVKRVFEK